MEAVTIIKNEILPRFNMTERFILESVEVKDGKACSARYVRKQFGKEADFAVTSVNYNINDLLNQSEEPR